MVIAIMGVLYLLVAQTRYLRILFSVITAVAEMVAPCMPMIPIPVLQIVYFQITTLMRAVPCI